MSTVGLEKSAPAPARPVTVVAPAAEAHSPAAPAVRSRLAWVCAAHATVDFFSAIILPILTVLEGRVGMSPGQGAVLIGIGSLSSGLIQPVVAWLSDRFDTRALGTIGLVVAALAIGSVGYAHTFAQLVAIQIVGAAGIGAFHPVAAAAMGQLSGAKRSVGVAVFFTAGMIGGVVGSLFAPFYTRRFGLPAMVWTIPPGLVVGGLLAWAIHSIAHRTHDAHARHSALPARERQQRWLAVGLLFTGNALRFTVNMALCQLIIRWSEALTLKEAGTDQLSAALRTQSATHNGPLQAAMQVGMGFSGLLLGFVISHKHERRTLVLVPCLGATAVAALPHTSGLASFLVAALCGVGYAGIIPITIAMAQRLLPHRTSLASGLMMGGAWSIAALGPILAQVLCDHAGLSGAFLVVAAMLLAAGLVSVAIPGRVIGDSAR